jgi:hypothetical protein
LLSPGALALVELEHWHQLRRQHVLLAWIWRSWTTTLVRRTFATRAKLLRAVNRRGRQLLLNGDLVLIPRWMASLGAWLRGEKLAESRLCGLWKNYVPSTRSSAPSLRWGRRTWVALKTLLTHPCWAARQLLVLLLVGAGMMTLRRASTTWSTAPPLALAGVAGTNLRLNLPLRRLLAPGSGAWWTCCWSAL